MTLLPYLLFCAAIFKFAKDALAHQNQRSKLLLCTTKCPADPLGHRRGLHSLDGRCHTGHNLLGRHKDLR